MEAQCSTCPLHASKLTNIRTPRILVFSILQETKFKEAAGFYEAIVKKNFDNVSFAAVYDCYKCIIATVHI